MKRGRILALDPSKTRTGWCAMEGPGPVKLLAHGSFRSADIPGFADRLHDVMDRWIPDLVVYEEPLQVIALYGRKGLLPGQEHFAAPNAAQTVLWKIEGAVEAIAFGYNVPVHAVTPRTWRKQVLGDGAMPKDRAKARARQYCDYAFALQKLNEDEAEAVCIGVYGATSQVFRFVMEKEASQES